MKTYRDHRVIFLLLLIAGLGFIFSSGYTQEVAGSNVKIIQDDRIDLLVSKHIQLNENRKGIPGFRIQIFFDSGNNSKTNAEAMYSGFSAKYPEMPVYLSFKSPNYKVRVGDFRMRLDAQRFLNAIIGEYPGAWIIEDQVNLPKVEQ
jgi:hypothetical protein